MDLIPGLIRNRLLLERQAGYLENKELQKFLTEHTGEVTLDLTYEPDSSFMWILVSEDEDDDLVFPFQDLQYIIGYLRADGTLEKAFKIIEAARLAEIRVARNMLIGVPREVSVGVMQTLSCGEEIKVDWERDQLTKRRYFRFYCKDADSDTGQVEMLFRAPSLSKAWDAVRREVVTKGRPELLNKLSCDQLILTEQGLIFSNVENSYEPSDISAHGSSGPPVTCLPDPVSTMLETGAYPDSTRPADLRSGDVGPGEAGRSDLP